MAATIGAIAAGISALTGVGTALAGGGGSRQRQSIYGDEYGQAMQDALDAKLAGVETSRLGRAGFSDSAGSGLRYDPVTNTWVSSLGPLPQAVQTAADAAAISRNTTDLRQAQGANARADVNASRAQPLIDAAMRRMADFRPQTADELTSLLTNQAADANTQTYRPIIQAITQAANRSSSNAGDQIAKVGQGSADNLRRGMIEARIAALQGTEGINNSRRQGLAGDLATATAAGTPQFQYPTITPSTNNKDMLAAITNRATGSAYTNALAQSGVNAANKERSSAAGLLAGSYPATDPFLSGLYSGSQQLSNLFKDKNVAGKLDEWFGPSATDKAAQAKNDLINS